MLITLIRRITVAEEGNMKSLVKNSLFNALYQVLNMIFPLISSIYVARTLMPEGVGRVAYAQNIASYFVTAAALGIPTVGVRAISNARDDKEKLNRTFSELTIINACSTLLSLAFYLVLVFCNPAFLADCQLYFAAGLVILFNAINIDWLYQGNEEYAYIVVRSILMKIVSLLALFLFVKEKDDYIIYAIISSLAICGNYVFNAIRARKYVTLQFFDLNLQQHIKPVFLFAGTLFFAAIYSKVDTTMLGAMVGEESVAFYSYAHKVLHIGVGFCAAVTTAFLPRLSYYFQKDKEQFFALVAQGVQIIAFLSIPAATGLFILAPEAIDLLFGRTFLPAAQTLRIFSVLIIIFAFGNLMCYQMMICSGNEKKHVVVLASAAGINVILNVLLIPKLQHNGAAVASVITELFINVVEGLYFTHLLKLKFDWQVIKQAVLSSGIMGAILAVTKFFANGTILSFIFSVSIGIVVYISMNILLKNRFTMNAVYVIQKKMMKR